MKNSTTLKQSQRLAQAALQARRDGQVERSNQIWKAALSSLEKALGK